MASRQPALNPLAEAQSNHKLRDFLALPDLHRWVRGCSELAPWRVDCKNHPSVAVAPLIEPLDIVIQRRLVGRTFDLHKRNFGRGWIFSLHINPFTSSAQSRNTFPSRPRQDEVNQVLEIFGRESFNYLVDGKLVISPTLGRVNSVLVCFILDEPEYRLPVFRGADRCPEPCRRRHSSR
jgi:hypothetical protein